MSKSLEAKCLKWKQLDEQLKAVKAEEMALRIDICMEVIGNRQGTFTETEDVGDMIVKVKSKTTTKIDEELLTSIWDDLSEGEQACFKYKPSLVKKQLDLQSKDSVVYDCLTEEPATPSLSID